MLHFLPNYFFSAAERQHKKRLRNQTPHAFTRTNKKHAMLHQCNILRHPHRQNASQFHENRKKIRVIRDLRRTRLPP